MNFSLMRLTEKLLHELNECTYHFIKDNVKDEEENISHLLDLILSAYISSLLNSLQSISSGNPIINNWVKEFTHDLLSYLGCTVKLNG